MEISWRFRGVLLTGLVVAAALGSWCWADESAKDVSDGGAAKGNVQPDAWRNRWSIFWGLANVHARLQESESEINHQLNDTFGRIIPGWERPTTFKNWSNEFKLWDAHVGVGRDINEQWSWFVDVGGIIGTVRNNETYHIPIPLKADIDFSRLLWFAAAGVDYYPWGKPCLARSQAACMFLRCLAATKPFVELAAGHVDAKESADVKFSIPNTLARFKQRQDLHHEVNYISPRIGIETPLGKNDSVSLQAGYLFFDSHAIDFNNLSIYFLHHHKF